MFIGHLPAGYVLTRWLQKRLKTAEFLWVGLVASIAPDLDMLYFYLIDDRQTLHHHYWTHLPLPWVIAWLGITAIGLAWKKKKMVIVTTIIFANLIVHFLLDSIVGGISWLYPLSEYDLRLFTVPATHDFWVWSFVLHWTFLFEIGVVIAAVILFSLERKRAVGGRTKSLL